MYTGTILLACNNLYENYSKLARLSYYNLLRPNLRPTIQSTTYDLVQSLWKYILVNTYLLKWLGCSLGRRLVRKL